MKGLIVDNFAGGGGASTGIEASAGSAENGASAGRSGYRWQLNINIKCLQSSCVFNRLQSDDPADSGQIGLERPKTGSTGSGGER